MNREAVTQLITAHEGKKYGVYLDSEGIRTVAIGMNLEAEGARLRIEALGVDYNALCAGECSLNEDHVQILFGRDLNIAVADAAALISNFWDLPDDAQHAVIDMTYNLGGPRFAKFTKMIAALEVKDYLKAAAEMADSRWAKQVPSRAAEDIALVRGCAE